MEPLNLNDLDVIIQRLLATSTLEPCEFIEGYDFVYDYCHQVPAKKKTEKLTAMANQRQTLYNHISTLLTSHIDTVYQRLFAVPVNDKWLSSYNHEFQLYRRSIAMLHGICRYLQNSWIKPERAEGKHSVLEIEQLGKSLWRERLFDKFKQEITETVLQLIEAERNGDKIDRLLLQNCIRTYIKLDFNETNQFYEEQFEGTYLVRSKAFYEVDFDKYYENHEQCQQFTDFLQYIGQRLYEEALRCCAKGKSYLVMSTFEKIERICIEIMIRKYRNECINAYKKFLPTIAISNEAQPKKNVNQKLQRLHFDFIKRFLTYSTEMAQELSDIFEFKIKNDVQQMLRAEKVLKNPKQYYINEMYNVYCHYKEIITNFSNNQKFNDALDRVYTEFMTKGNNINLTRTAKLLSIYCDDLMKKTIEADKLNEEFDKIFAIMKYIYELDEDLFYPLYYQKLVKRLMKCESASDNVEERLIRSFKQKYNATEAEELYNDIKLGVWDFRFKTYLKSTGNRLQFDFNVNIIRNTSLLPKNDILITLPPILENTLQMFKQFYKESNDHHTLKWRYELSVGELVSNCFKKEYRFSANTLQMIILLQFNERLHYTANELAKNTNIATKTVIEILKRLLQIKLLKRAEAEDQNSLEENHKVELSLGFKNRNSLVKLTQ